MLQNELPTYIIVLPQQAKVAFVATSIGTVARTSGKSYGGVHDRMVRRGLIYNYIYPCYDTLHTKSRENFVADLLLCLDNWEGDSHEQHHCISRSHAGGWAPSLSLWNAELGALGGKWPHCL